MLAAGKSAGYSEKTLKNARNKVANTRASGFGKDRRSTWDLRIGPFLGPVGPTNQTPGSMGPMTGPKGDNVTPIRANQGHVPLTPGAEPGHWIGSGEPV